MASIEGAGPVTQPSRGEGDPDRRMGVVAALGSYGTWGFFPILFRALDGINPLTVVAHRVIWSFVLVGAILAGRGRLGEVKAVFSSWASARGILISSTLLAANWLIFVWAVDSEKVLEVSFGYFINPLISVAIGVVLLGERMNRIQWISISMAAVAIGIQAVGLSGLPYVSLSLALLFGFYGYFRKTVNVGSAAGLFVETLVLLPVALAYLAYTFVVGGLGPHGNPMSMGLLILTGPATSWALILFVYAARRLPLSTMGMFQYIAPSLHFFLAIWLFGEALNLVQLLSFALIWVSLAVYSYDSFRRRSSKVSQGNG